MMITKDYHVHERHSGDAAHASVLDYCQVAEDRGIDEIGFCTHLIIAGSHQYTGISPSAIPSYFKEIETAQTFTRVQLKVGLEVDYFPEAVKQLESIIDDYPFDFILGSLHFLQGHSVMRKRGLEAFCSTRPVKELVKTYYHLWREAIETGLFDVMAHPDYFRRPFPASTLRLPPIEEYVASLYSAIESLKSYSVGIEVNTSGWRHGLQDCYPSQQFLEIAKEVGIQMVTIGSDSHRTSDLGRYLTKAIDRLKQVRFSHLALFEKRRSYRIALSELTG
jgi:histidinol-phosphatase (PHP family)